MVLFCHCSVKRVANSSVGRMATSGIDILSSLFRIPLEFHGYNQNLFIRLNAIVLGAFLHLSKKFKDFLTIWGLSVCFRIFEI